MEISNLREQISNKKGYTLIEILVALTIIGLLFNFGYVSFRDFSRRQAVAGAAKTIQGDLRLAQENAISGQKPPDNASCKSPLNTLDSYSFTVYPPSEYRIEANCTGSAIAIPIKDVFLPFGITLSTPSPNPLKFKILGQGTNVGASNWILTLTQAGTGNPATVTVTSGGEIR